MIEVTKDTQMPSIEQAAAILTENNNRMGIPLDVDRMLEYQAVFLLKGERIKQSIQRYIGWTGVGEMTGDEFRAFLSKSGVNTGLLSGKRGPSLSAASMQSAIATELYSEELCKLMEMWSEASSCNTRVGMFTKILENHRIVPLLTYDKHRMIFVHPTWSKQNTGRLGMTGPAMQNVAKILADIRTCPEGWIYVATDSGQIEPRIIQSAYINDPQIITLINLYNDAYYGYIHYCNFLTQEDIRSGRTDFTPIEITDTMKEYRKKFKTFGNATMYGSRENKGNDSDKAKFIARIGDHPKRLQWQYNIKRAVDSGQIIFPTYWGTPLDISKSPGNDEYEYGSDGLMSHLYKCALNNPVQGTAADLMRLSVIKANGILRRKAPNSVILEYKHDSGSFAIHESDYDKVIDDIKGITSYQVEGWIPIYGDLEIGFTNTSGIERLI